MPPLRDVQRAFYRLVTGPGPVAGDGGGLFMGPLQVYAEMYFARLHDVLAEQHERLAAGLGADAFRALVAGYLAHHAPRSHDVGDAGDRLPGHLAEVERARPWLADLARLERLHVTLLTAADAEPLDVAALALAPAALERRPLALVPAHALLRSAWALDELWDDPRTQPRAAPTRLLVWRDDIEVRHRRVDAREWPALERVARGCTVGELGAALGGSIADAARQLYELIGRWAADGLLRG